MIFDNQSELDAIFRCPNHPQTPLERIGDLVKTGWRCSVCGKEYFESEDVKDFTAMESQTDPNYQAEADQWDRQAGQYEERRAHDEVYMAGIHAAVRALAPRSGERVLDAGCGTGLTVRTYESLGAQIVALDASFKSLRYLRSKLADKSSTTCVCGDLTHLPFADNSFDAIVCANALQQIEDPDRRQHCVRELSRVLQPGGRLVVTVHHYSWQRNWRGIPKEGSAGGYSGAVRYIFRFQSRELVDLLGHALDGVRVHGAAFPLPYRLKLSPISRRLERWLWSMPSMTSFGSMLVGAGCKPDQPNQQRQ